MGLERVILLIAICLNVITIAKGKKFTFYLQNEIELVNERHTYSDFRYETANTKVDTYWVELPEDKKATIREAHEIKDCEVHLKLKLIDYKYHNRTVCLYRDMNFARNMDNMTIDVEGKSFTRKEFIEEIHPVKGFVVHEMNSLVKGYLIGGYFYGTIRMYDAFSAYHIHFYVDPIPVLGSYTMHPIDERDMESDHNAIIFEYVGHDAEVGAIRPAEDIAKEQYEMERNATGEPVLIEWGGLTINLARQKRNANDEPNNEKEPDHIIDHSIEHGPHPHLSPHAQHRKEAGEALMETTSDDIVIAFHDDVAGVIPLQAGISNSDIFDTSSEKATLCTLCVWIDPFFAQMYGFLNGRMYGVAEVIEMLRRIDWLYRAKDFNMDSIAENFGFKVKAVVSTYEINVEEFRENRRRRRRGNVDPETVASTNETDMGSMPPFNVSNPPKKTHPKNVYKYVLHQLQTHPTFSECCGIVGFAYLDLTPVLSVSTIRGLCSKENLLLIGGLLHGHKVGIFDLQRAAMHGLGHMMGSEHDKTMKAKCQDRKPSKFYNPFTMHPVQQANVGLRPNTFRFSPCSKLEITAFLNSNNIIKCLVNEIDDFCGNGMIDPGEECDCGSAWQCHLEECCGESDTIFRCQVIRRGRNTCERPQKW